MFRYVAFVWNPSDLAQTDVAHQLGERLRGSADVWRCTWDARGVCVYTAGARVGSMEPQLLDNSRGVILGKVFKRGCSAASTRPLFNSTDVARLVESGGRVLVTSYWGNYVAIVQDTASRRTWVLRGPLSSLPCFRVMHQGVQVLFSFMGDCLQLDAGRYTVNWKYVAARMVAMTATRDTGLREVCEIQPGECFEVCEGRTREHVYWSAIELSRSGVIKDPEAATAELGRATRECVHAWASCYDSIVHTLSGGLDSSIVLACLRDAPMQPHVTCVTYYGDGTDMDEREYARAAVKGFPQCTHVEQRRESDVRLDGMLSARPSATPQGYVGYIEVARSQTELAATCKSSAMFSGGGGDSVYLQYGARLCAADFVYCHGLRPGLLRVAYNAAQMEGVSVWRILHAAMKEGLIVHERNMLAEVADGQTLVSADLKRMVKNGELEWHCESTRRAPPGKLWHIFGMARLDDYYSPVGEEDDPEQITPLFSQPLAEACLRTATYTLMIGGWDRAIARRAFANDLPPMIIRRRSKGGIAEHRLRILRANLPFARDLLINGLLVRNGLLDGKRVSAALSGAPSAAMNGIAEIFAHLSTEAWLRRWA